MNKIKELIERFRFWNRYGMSREKLFKQIKISVLNDALYRGDVLVYYDENGYLQMKWANHE